MIQRVAAFVGVQAFVATGTLTSTEGTVQDNEDSVLLLMEEGESTGFHNEKYNAKALPSSRRGLQGNRFVGCYLPSRDASWAALCQPGENCLDCCGTEGRMCTDPYTGRFTQGFYRSSVDAGACLTAGGCSSSSSTCYFDDWCEPGFATWP